MLKKMTIFGFLIMLSSCATILNEKNYNIYVKTNSPKKAQIKYNDSIYELPTMLNVQRSKNDLSMTLISDTLKKDFLIKSSLSEEFVYKNLVWLPFAPIGYLVDLSNDKRYTYGKLAVLNIFDKEGIVRNERRPKYITKQGQANLMMTLPFGSSFYMQPQNESPKKMAGLIGIGTGLEYYYSDKKFINFTLTSCFMNENPFPEPVDRWYEHEYMGSTYFMITDNIRLNRFSFGYGLSYSSNKWKLTYLGGVDSIPKPRQDPISKTSHSVGFAFNGYYQIGKVFCIGLIYRPSFLKVYPEAEFKYEHLASLDLTWKIKLAE